MRRTASRLSYVASSDSPLFNVLCRVARRWGPIKTLSIVAVIVLMCFTNGPAQAQSLVLANLRVQQKIVKIYGAGGARGLESYQSGFLISDEGHILTAWSYVLDTSLITVVTRDGRRLEAELVGADPRLELAVLKVPTTGMDYFELDEAVSLQSGDRVLAFSNLYGIATGNEPASVLKGFVSAVAPLSARRGTFETPYDGPVYIVDAMTNNAGAAGGALTDYQGRLAGVLGKELRSKDSNIWLNYAIPVSEFRAAVQDILDGKVSLRSVTENRRPAESMTLADLGIFLLPNVLPQTPPYIERVRPKSSAAAAGIRPDDLLVMIDGRTVRSTQEVIDEMKFIDRLDAIRLTVLRDQGLINVELTVEAN